MVIIMTDNLPRRQLCSVPNLHENKSGRVGTFFKDLEKQFACGFSL
jgi:hypothetical protein